MKANTDKQLEKFVENVMKEVSLEKPSPDFTSKLMTQVLAADIKKATAYKPLISTWAWVIIFGFIISLLGYIIFNSDAQVVSWFQYSAFDEINHKILNSFSGFKISNITFYAVALATVMLFIQITLLKNYFNNRVGE